MLKETREGVYRARNSYEDFHFKKINQLENCLARENWTRKKIITVGYRNSPFKVNWHPVQEHSLLFMLKGFIWFEIMEAVGLPPLPLGKFPLSKRFPSQEMLRFSGWFLRLVLSRYPQYHQAVLTQLSGLRPPRWRLQQLLLQCKKWVLPILSSLVRPFWLTHSHWKLHLWVYSLSLFHTLK